MEIQELDRLQEEEMDSIESVTPPSDIIAFNELRSCVDI